MQKGPRLKAARRMRHAPSYTEAELWKLLRNRELNGLKFRRQVPLGPYVVDFLCYAHRLIVEADGPFHDPDRDELRDAWLAAQGFEVLRFPNSSIHNRAWQVLQDIQAAAAKRPPLLPAV